MSVLRYIKLFNAIVNSVGSVAIWWYVIEAIRIGLELLKGKV